jgi:hypothetical protein
MHTNNYFRAAALSVALTGLVGSASAHSIYDYSYEEDVWPLLQAQRNVPQTVVNSDPAPRTDATKAAPMRDLYDRHDRSIDQRSGILLPGAPHTGF